MWGCFFLFEFSYVVVFLDGYMVESDRLVSSNDACM
jgi:hypothetical protein